MSRTDSPDDPHCLVHAERSTWPFPPELAECDSLDSELPTDVFHLTRRRPAVTRDVSSIYPGREPVIHNAFWVPGKVPSLNELLDAKVPKRSMGVRSIIMGKVQGKSNSRHQGYVEYNTIKQEWKRRTVRALGNPFVRVESAHFAYLVVEESMKRDPSNICSAAIKFIEDGLVEAGVIPNDGWKQVRGIRMHCIHRPDRDPGVYVVMSDRFVDELHLINEYEDDYKQRCQQQ